MVHALVVAALCARLGLGAAPVDAQTVAGENPTPAVAAGHKVDLWLDEPLGFPRKAWPVTAGVPFPAGTLQDPARLTLREVGEGGKLGTLLPLQVRTLSRWPDGSVRWALLDWQVDLAPRQQRQFLLEMDAGQGTPASAGGRVALRETTSGVEIDTGALRFSIPKKSFALFTDVRVDDTAVISGPVVSFMTVDGKRMAAKAPTSVTVTEAGSRRARIELRGDYSAEFGYVIRIDAFANLPFVRVLHSFEQHAPPPYTEVNQIGLEVPLQFEGPVSYRAAQDSGAAWSGKLPDNGFTLYQEDNASLHLNGTRQPGRARGWVDLQDANRGVAVAARYFWQEYPQSFHLRGSGLTYNMWAPEAAPARVGMGAAKTHELYVYFHGKVAPTPDVLTALSHPLLVRLPPQWVVASAALPNSIVPGAPTTAFMRELDAGFRRYQVHADKERWDDSGAVFCSQPEKQRERRGFYGMFNWGDWNFPGYHDTVKGCDSWGNLEYDTAQVLALAYAATGQRAYFDAMVAAARHFMDVDRIHFQSEHPNWVGMNHPKDPLHFAFELGGVDLGHTWTEGLLSYYSLTGDDRALEAARGIADYLVARLASGLQRGNPRQWGWPQIALVAAYETTGNGGYKSAAQEYARRGMRAYPPDDVTHWKMGILGEALSYTHGVTDDPAIRDWLERYAKAASAAGGTADARLAPAVAYVGRMTANIDYLRFAEATSSRLQFGGWGKPFTLAGRLGFRILALTAGATPRHVPVAAARPPTQSAAASTPVPKTPGMWESLNGNWQPTPEAWAPMVDPFGEQ